MATRHSHYWLIGPPDAALWAIRAAGETMDGPDSRTPAGEHVIIDCDTGPETSPSPAPACAELVRRLYGRLVSEDPAALRRNMGTFHLLAPDLLVDARAPTPVEQLALSTAEVLRLSQALPELLYAWGSNGTAIVAFLHADRAGNLDRRLIGAMVRGVPPEVVRVMVCTATDDIPSLLRTTLEDTATRCDLRALRERQHRRIYPAVHTGQNPHSAMHRACLPRRRPYSRGPNR